MSLSFEKECGRYEWWIPYSSYRVSTFTYPWRSRDNVKRSVLFSNDTECLKSYLIRRLRTVCVSSRPLVRRCHTEEEEKMDRKQAPCELHKKALHHTATEAMFVVSLSDRIKNEEIRKKTRQAITLDRRRSTCLKVKVATSHLIAGVMGLTMLE